MLFRKKTLGCFSHLTDDALCKLIIAVRLEEAELLRICIEIDHRIHLLEYHGVSSDDVDLYKLSTEAWDRFKSGYSLWK